MRAFPTEVLALRPSTVDPVPFIAIAHLLVDQALLTRGVGEETLAMLEVLLTAHLMELSSPGVVSKQIGDTRIAYDRKSVGSGLLSTRYGQMVAALDPTGLLLSGTERPARLWVV
jgi:hypothetical protein